jgi:hypothetical protein
MRLADNPGQPLMRFVYEGKSSEDLKDYLSWCGLTRLPTRKGERLELLLEYLSNDHHLRALYEGLSHINKLAVQEAVADPEGRLDTFRFKAKYGSSPYFGRTGYHFWSLRREPSTPSTLPLFFPDHRQLPQDLQDRLRRFVPAPPVFQLPTLDEPPARVMSHRRKHPEEEVRIRHTATSALQEVIAVLRLIDTGEVRVSDKTRRPGQATVKVVGKVLREGDWYSQSDESANEWDPASDLTMKPFAWPMLLQGGGLATVEKGRLRLTPSGRKATTQPAHEVIRSVWRKWQKTTLLDEFNRISVIKGQQSKGKGGLTAVSPRRQAIAAVLAECPHGRWIAIEELFRFAKLSEYDFQVCRDPWKLYIHSKYYGSFGYEGYHEWEVLEGRYLLAFLFEYAATLGLIDVAYIHPVGARNDYQDHWGTDDLSCLSQYDGLRFVRINALGAWCLGQVDRYVPEPIKQEDKVRVLPNLDVVAERPLSPADVLLLERFAEKQGEVVWHLSPARTLDAVAEGLRVSELKEFLTAKSANPLPHTVEVFLEDVEARAEQLRDLGTARMVECRDGHVAQLLVHDRRLRGLCRLAGERWLVFATQDEPAVRKALRELGYPLPPPC